MSDPLKAKPPRGRRAAWTAGVLCAACCAVPIAGLVFGSATLAAFALYFEVAATGAGVLAVAWIVYKIATRGKAAACGLDCGRRPAIKQTSEPKRD